MTVEQPTLIVVRRRLHRPGRDLILPRPLIAPRLCFPDRLDAYTGGVSPAGIVTGNPRLTVYDSSMFPVYTPTAGAVFIRVQAQADGGGGGGVAATAAGQAAIGLGGGGGQYVEYSGTPANLAGEFGTGFPWNFSVGAGGIGGATGNNPGSAGTGVTISGAAFTIAVPGNGGAADVGSAVFPRNRGLIGGGGSNGDITSPPASFNAILLRGGNSQPSYALSATVALSGGGGGSPGPFGAPAGAAGQIVQNDGGSVTAFGAGGGGGLSLNGGAAQAGGHGGPALVVITEYFP